MDVRDAIEQPMGARKEAVESGEVAFCTPEPKRAIRSSARNRPVNPPAPPTRPRWAPHQRANPRKDLSATEQMIICKAIDSLAAIPGDETSPLLKNVDWGRENPRG